MGKKISVREAAELMNCSPQFIRIGLQRGTLPFGYAVKMSSKWTYNISAHQINKYLGIESNESQEKVQ
ncbi:hypothetical protein [Anaerosolibacter sp.]|uniref:hypothetical protein n=1 Tax=Anaerosolibacter sp. TaxID=1872527 RepID=UPI0039EF6AAD